MSALRWNDDRSAATVQFLREYERLVRTWGRELATDEYPLPLIVRKVDRRASTKGLNDLPEDPAGIGVAS